MAWYDTLLRRFGVGARKAAPAGNGSLSTVHSGGSWFSVFDWRPGAWQAHEEVASKESILAFSAVYACVQRIAADIAKLRPMAIARRGTSWAEVDSEHPSVRVLQKPNRYQTRVQFLENWCTSRLLHGNTYALKERDERRRVRALYVLDPDRVQTLVAPNGDVYYRLSDDYLAGVEQQMVMPASEIIHDRHAALWHPLVGISPISACGLSATQGRRIQNNSSKFFENMSRPSGMLTAPGRIDDVTEKRIKDQFEKSYGGDNIGRLLVAGNGLEYKPMTVNAHDAQLIDQLKWSVEDVARAFSVPLWKIGAGQMPAYGNSELAQRAYYSETLQHIIEGIEVLLREGLELERDFSVEFDLQGLLRMDTEARYKANSEGVKGGWLTPNEARASEGLPGLSGGDTVYLQEQNWPIHQLAARDTPSRPPTAPTRELAPIVIRNEAPPPAHDFPREAVEACDRLMHALVEKMERLGAKVDKVAARRSMEYLGAWREGQRYEQGAVVNFRGALFFCAGPEAIDRPDKSRNWEPLADADSANARSVEARLLLLESGFEDLTNGSDK